MANQSSTLEKYDSTLLGILQNEGQIAKFVDVMIGFLYRRTDFFHIMQSKDEKLGFPRGVAPSILIKTYERYEQMASKRDISKDTRRIIPAQSTNVTEQKTEAETSSASTTDQKRTIPETVAARKDEKLLDDKTATPEADIQRKFQADPESHNGAVREGYRWAQTLTDCDIRVKVPNHIKKAKQLQVVIARKHIKVSYTGEDGKPAILVDSDLTWEINASESMWSLNPADCVHLNVEKVKERWWENVFLDEKKIDTQKIEAVMPMDHLDDGAQSVVEQLRYDEHQKQLGLPTSKDQKMHETLKKAWNAEGSPFKGQPFDPSKVNMSNNASFGSQ